MNGGALTAKRALVMGGGSGIGRAVVGAYLAQGAQVVVLDRDEAKLGEIRTEFPDVGTVVGDVRSFEDCERAVGVADDRFGGLDILACCAGIFDFYRSLDTYSPGDLAAGFEEILSVNVLGQLMPVRAAMGALRASRGTIILTASSSAFYPGRGGPLYLASKFALRGCVASLAHELAPEIRVNGVAPGGTMGTDITGPRSIGMGESKVVTDGGRRADLRALSPLGLAMTPDDHAGSYVFLASEAANGMTGTFLHPDGGMGIRG